MKEIIFALSLSAACSVFAVTVTGTAMDPYVKAIAGSKGSFKCVYTKSATPQASIFDLSLESLKDSFNTYTSLEVKSNGDQPALIFMGKSSADPKLKAVLSFSTDKTFKIIQGISYSEYSVEIANVGTLVDPKFDYTDVEVTHVDCTANQK
jgi:hypothetical protein